MSDWELAENQQSSSEWEPVKEPRKFDKGNFAKMMIGLMSGNVMPIAQKLIETNLPKIPEAISHGYNLVSNAEGLPKQSLRDVGAAATDILSSIPNTLLSIPEQAEEIGLIPEGYANKVPKVPSLSHKGENASDKLFRALLGQAPIMYGGVKAAPTIARGATQFASKIPTRVAGKKNPALTLQANLLENQIESQAQEVEKAKLAAREQGKIHKQAVGEAKRLTNISDENKIEFALNKQKEDISAAQEKAGQLEANLQSIEPPPEEPQVPEERTVTPPVERNIVPPKEPKVLLPEAPEKTSGEHVAAAEKAADEAAKVEEMVSQAKEHHENVSRLDEEANQAIGEHLNLGSAHHIHVGRYLKNQIDNIEETAKSGFKKLKEKIKNAKFKMSNALPFQIDMDNVLTQLRAGKDPNKLSSPATDNPFVSELLEKAPTVNDVMASDFITKYQDWRDARYKLKGDMKSVESSAERRQISDALKYTEQADALIRKTLSEGLGEFKPEWDRVNKLYSDVVYPLRNNSIVRSRLKEGKSSKLNSSNMAEQLAGDEPGSNILREMIKNNPEALKHVVGQRYENGAPNVHTPNEILTEYTEKLPQLNEMLKGKKATEEMKNKAESHLENVKKQHEKAKKHANRLSNAAVRAGREESRIYKEYTEKKKDYDKTISSYEKDKKQYEKDLKKQAKERKDYESQLSVIEKEKESYKSEKEKHEKQLKDRDAKIAKAEKDIEDHKKDIESMESRAELLEDQMKSVRQEANRKNINLEKKFKEEKKLSKMKKELSKINKDISDSTTGLHKAIFFVRTLYKLGLKVKRII